MALTIGQFLAQQSANPDTPDSPYTPAKSLLEIDLPEVPFQPQGPAPVPQPPPVGLSSPAAVPPPPNVTVSTPSALPPPPAVQLSSPAALPPEVAPPPTGPAALPPPPAVQLSVPANLPPEIAPPHSIPANLPPEPAPAPSIPATLPQPPSVVFSQPSQLPQPPVFNPDPNQAFNDPQNPATKIPPPPVFNADPDQAFNDPQNPAKKIPPPPVIEKDPDQAFKDPVNPAMKIPDPVGFNPDTGYKIFPDSYSHIGGAAAGDLALDPELYDRQLDRTFRLPPGKLATHALTQVGLFALNVFGTVWNPAMVDPPPIGQGFIMPALDLGFDGKTELLQVQIGALVDEALDDKLDRLTDTSLTNRGSGILATLPPSDSLSRIFENTKRSVANAAGDIRRSTTALKDPLVHSAFTDGIIPMAFKEDNEFGFRKFSSKTGDGSGGDTGNDDAAYVPLSFADLRPIQGQESQYRVVYFRPLITNFAESFSPEWNKAQYLGRVDPVASYQGTGRSISLGFKLVAFGPEDVRTIYQKLHWLTSMVYPSYNSDVSYNSGPVIRMRIGDVINGQNPFATEGARGLPGIIESLDFDYSDKLWELKNHWKVPREVDVALSFTVLHDMPVGIAGQGLFGGIGNFRSGANKGIWYPAKVTSNEDLDAGVANPREFLNARNEFFRKVGSKDDFRYDTFEGIDGSSTPHGPKPPKPPVF